MASRPLPPGRRGKSIRSASALQLTEEVKLLDVQDKPIAQPTIPEQPVSDAPTPIPATIVEQPAAYVSAAPPSAVTEPQKPKEADSVYLAQDPRPATPQPETQSFTAPAPVFTAPTAAYEAPIVAPVVLVVPTVDVAAPVPAPVKSIETAPSVESAASPSAANMEAEVPDVSEGYHPFQLLLPVDAVPVLPDSIECVYDDAAVLMQKNVLKVVKTLFKKDRSKLEDFKINSRLFGNDFMDSEEYLDSLVKDLGGVRALQFVPCLLSIQPDEMKRNSLLLAARTYRMRNLASLELQVQALNQQAPPVPAARKSHTVVAEAPKVEERPQPPAVETPAPVVLQTAKAVSVVTEQLPTPALASAPGVEVPSALLTTVTAQSVEAVCIVESEPLPAPIPVFSVISEEPTSPPLTPVLAQPVEAVELEPFSAPALSPVIAEEEPTPAPLPPVVQTVEAVSAIVEPLPTPASAPTTVVATAEEPTQMPDNDFLAHIPVEFRQAFLSDFQEKQVTKPSLIKVDIHAAPVPPPVIEPLQPIAPIGSNEVTYTEVESTPDHVTFSVKVRSAEVEPAAVQEIASESSNSFASDEKAGLPDSSKKTDGSYSNPVGPAAHSVNLFGEPLSGDESVDEGENLFGEAIAPAQASKSETSTQWNVPTASPNAVKPAQPLLFGYATAGADDSDYDSDDSGFSSP